MSYIREALEHIRQTRTNDRERGAAFECLAKIFLEHDPTQAQQFSQVWHYQDWAQGKSVSQHDIGIDLVAKLRSEQGYCAVQCKFYQPEHSISKADLDSFIAASNTADFQRLLLIDTSMQSIGKNAQSVFDNLTQDYTRIQLSELEESRIDFMSYIRASEIRHRPKKELRDHQIKALEAVREGLAQADRGKLIMACGLGKTLTSLRIAEDLAVSQRAVSQRAVSPGGGKRVLVMVPSLALMSQSIREWKNDAAQDFTAFSACSDKKVGLRKRGSDDAIDVNLHDLAFPATTDAEKLAKQIKQADASQMTVVFSTYQSIDVIARAQHDSNLSEFDLIICDEAHRTTGATLSDEDESHFVRIHDNTKVKGKKRLYMTATPRIYGEKSKQRAEKDDIALASMDDEATYGKMLFHYGFGSAIAHNLLTDYKVVVLAMDEKHVSYHAQRSLASGSELKLDDATKMVGCYKALAKMGMNGKELRHELMRPEPMRQAIAFCQTIKLSKMFASEFGNVINDYTANEHVAPEGLAPEFKTDLEVQLRHVDGTFNAALRNEKLSWLGEDTDNNICRVLSNARCLSEGVDVPALDAIMFLHPRKSQIDVVQSVGRVMRKAEGKDMGYVIIPIAVAPGIAPDKALNDNERYRVIWQILNALRAHDERLDRDINKLGLGEDVSDRIDIIDGTAASGAAAEELAATTSVVEDIKSKPKQAGEDEQGLGGTEAADTSQATGEEPQQYAFYFQEYRKAIKAKIVEKCGTRDYWDNWAQDIARIAQAHIHRINGILIDAATPERQAFDAFLERIRDDLNPQISDSDAVEMLAQHIITGPVFDSLFQGNRFTSKNPVSQAMEAVLKRLYARRVDNEGQSLERFYASVKTRAQGIDTAQGRQALIKDLYDRFFRNAFPRMTQRLGIVYTPVDVIDFIIHSVQDVLRIEFNTSLADTDVHILDPFAGTGTFITRLLQSGLIPPERLAYKYQHEIHANEIVLLAYYVACINIEAVYATLMPQDQYQAFKGMVLTDSFQLYEQDKDMIANLLPDNSARRTKQKKRNITVVMGNPPYSIGQKSANDNAANIKYPNLDKRISNTYARASTAVNLGGLYDSYIRALRWASDRIGATGVIGFVTNAAYIDRPFADGLRATLAKECQRIYIINLRGDIRKNMLSHGAAGEGDNIFDSMTGVAITILVKNADSQHNRIAYCNIGQGLKKNQKLEQLTTWQSIKKVTFEKITANKYHDWIDQRNEHFDHFLPLGNKGNQHSAVFLNHTHGVVTNRDAWCINFSPTALITHLERMVSTYHAQFPLIKDHMTDKEIESDPRLDRDPQKISWSRSLYKHLRRKTPILIDTSAIRPCIYRPFQLTHLYFDNRLNEVQSQTHKLFPRHDSQNWVICVTGPGGRSGFSCLMAKYTPNHDLIEAGQCFPLFLFADNTDPSSLLTGEEKKSALHPLIVKKINHAYRLDNKIRPQDIFFYLYGLLHAPDYRQRFAHNLTKELPRLPLVKPLDDFRTFCKAGRALAKLHADFQEVEPYRVSIKQGDLRLAQIQDPKSFYHVKKMKFAKKGDRTSVIYNDNITIQNIPLEAWDYIVNGKPALQWVMDRQSVRTDKKASGIVNDANAYANETMNNPAYPLELFQRVITISLETMNIVRGLPELAID